MENPFANVGQIVRGDRFIGRQKIIDNVEKAVHTPRNLTIVGMHSIGKSSLVEKVIMRAENRFTENKILPIFLNLPDYENREAFFISLVTKCADKMEQILNSPPNQIQVLVETLRKYLGQEYVEWITLKETFEQFFSQSFNEYEYKVIFIVDEFDSACDLFEGEAPFSLLRQLGHRRDDYGVVFVLISRRSLAVIENATGSRSGYASVFHPQYLGLFEEEEFEVYFNWFESLNIKLSSEHKKRVRFYCGAHPYLLEMLGNSIITEYIKNSKVVDVDKAADAIRLDISKFYRDVTGLLTDAELLDILLRILFEPTIEVTRSDAEELLAYGFLIKDKQGHYRAYSEHFCDYLSEQHWVSEKVPLKSTLSSESGDVNHLDKKNITDEELKFTWSKTEPALREIITTIMSTLHGEDWIKTLKEQYDFFSNIIEGCRARMKGFENRSSGNRKLPESALFGYTYTDNLFKIILNDNLWNDYFQGIFCQDTNYWQIRSDFIHAIGRNHVEHNNMTPLDRDQRFIFLGYCEEILRIHREVKNSPPAVDVGNQNKEISDQGADESEGSDQDLVSVSTSATGIPTSAPVGTQKGTVNYINRNGWGRIKPTTCRGDHEDGVFVHISHFPDPTNLDSLQPNQHVEFEIQSTRKGWNAQNVTVIDGADENKG